MTLGEGKKSSPLIEIKGLGGRGYDLSERVGFEIMCPFGGKDYSFRVTP